MAEMGTPPSPVSRMPRRCGSSYAGCGPHPALNWWFANYSYHAMITDRQGDTLQLEADHRRHAEIENAIRDLKYGVGLNHLPSGAANGAWLAVQVMAHNLARWTGRIALGEQVATTKTLRRRLFSLAGRLTRKARRLILHLPRRWPWETQFLLPWRGCGPFHSRLDAIPTQGNHLSHPTIQGLPPTRANQASEGPLLTVVPQPEFPPLRATINPVRRPMSGIIGQAIPLISTARAQVPAFRWIWANRNISTPAADSRFEVGRS